MLPLSTWLSNISPINIQHKRDYKFFSPECNFRQTIASFIARLPIGAYLL